MTTRTKRSRPCAIQVRVTPDELRVIEAAAAASFNGGLGGFVRQRLLQSLLANSVQQ